MKKLSELQARLSELVIEIQQAIADGDSARYSQLRREEEQVGSEIDAICASMFGL